MSLQPTKYVASLWARITGLEELRAVKEVAELLAALARDTASAIRNLPAATAAAPSTTGLTSGALVHFYLSACPTGYTEYVAGQSRFLVGATPGDPTFDVGDTGGDGTHRHQFTFTTDDTDEPQGAMAGTDVDVALMTHTHTRTDFTEYYAQFPPFLALLLCQKD